MITKIFVASALPAAAIVGLFALTLPSGSVRGQEGDADASTQTVTAVGLDARVRGNSAESLGIIDRCTSVSAGDTFPVDLIVEQAEDLLAWEVYVQYDRLRLQVVNSDVALFLDNTSNSNVIDVSDPLPNRNGLYRVAAADIANPAALESGSGVLARLTFQAKTNGVTPIGLAYLDYDDDGVYDLGPRLIGPEGSEMGDTNGDGFFDGRVDSGRVVIGSSCAATTPAAEASPGSPADSTPAPSDGDEPGALDSSPTTPESSPDNEEEEVSVRETPASGRSPEEISRGPDDATGGTSIVPWIVAIIGVLGVLGALLVVAALRQTTRDI